jgi:hypothetical protein
MPSAPKLPLGLLATITLEVVPIRVHAPSQELPPFSLCILEVVFCEGVQHRLRFCLDHLHYVKMAAFEFYLVKETEKCSR